MIVNHFNIADYDGNREEREREREREIDLSLILAVEIVVVRSEVQVGGNIGDVKRFDGVCDVNVRRHRRHRR